MEISTLNKAYFIAQNLNNKKNTTSNSFEKEKKVENKNIEKDLTKLNVNFDEHISIKKKE